jgi:hypothetical protein
MMMTMMITFLKSGKRVEIHANVIEKDIGSNSRDRHKSMKGDRADLPETLSSIDFDLYVRIMGVQPESISERLHLAKPGILSCCTSAAVYSTVVEHVDGEFRDRWNGANLKYRSGRIGGSGRDVFGEFAALLQLCRTVPQQTCLASLAHSEGTLSKAFDTRVWKEPVRHDDA